MQISIGLDTRRLPCPGRRVYNELHSASLCAAAQDWFTRLGARGLTHRSEADAAGHQTDPPPSEDIVQPVLSDVDSEVYNWPSQFPGKIFYANAFAVQYNSAQLEVFLSIGSLNVPLVPELGDSNVPGPYDVTPIVRIALNPLKTIQLANLLMQTADRLGLDTAELMAEHEANLAALYQVEETPDQLEEN